MRVQHPDVHERKLGGRWVWFFRYYEDVAQPDGSIKTVRRNHIIGDSRDKANPIRHKQACEMRDAFLAECNADAKAPAAEPVPVAVVPKDKDEAKGPGDVAFGELAEVWRRDYVEGKAAGKPLLALPTRIKYRRCFELLLPRWQDVKLKDIRAKEVLAWLQGSCTSWHGMCGLRNAMSGVITKAIEWELVPETFANPIHRVRMPKKWEVHEKRILDPEQTAQVLALIDDPNRLICETCLDTGTRISEATGLMVKHVDLDKGTIHIEQRNFHGDIDVPKTAKSKRMLALGGLTERYKKWIASLKRRGPNDWVFPQDVDLTQPRWDSGVRKALKEAAASIKQNPDDPKDPGLDFPGFGMHSLRRANITWRQEVGGSTIEASRIAGHSKVDTTLEYTFIGMKRHDTLTRRIQQMREQAAKKTDLTAARPASELLARQRERAKTARAARKERRAEVVDISKGAVA